MSIHLYQHDLPDNISFGASVAIDTETMGLSLTRDRLCLVQLSCGDGTAHLVQIAADKQPCPNLISLLADKKSEKLFHFGRFDLAMLTRDIGPISGPIYCTKIASKMVRTYTDRHGLKNLLQELIGVDISKQQQSSDWGSQTLTNAQLDYAASDVLYLHKLRTELNARLVREGRMEMAQACFDFLPMRAQLDLEGWPEIDIFSH